MLNLWFKKKLFINTGNRSWSIDWQFMFSSYTICFSWNFWSTSFSKMYFYLKNEVNLFPVSAEISGMNKLKSESESSSPKKSFGYGWSNAYYLKMLCKTSSSCLITIFLFTKYHCSMVTWFLGFSSYKNSSK